MPASGAFAVSRPRTCGRRSISGHGAALGHDHRAAVAGGRRSCASSSGSAWAHWVMVPAPRQTTRSPGAARLRRCGGELAGPRQRRHMAMAVAEQPVDQRVAVDALDRRLAGGIDIGDDHHVGVVEAGAEFLEQMGQARVAVRLHDGDDLARGGGARGAQHGGDLDRMMAVIVDDGDAVDLAGLGEAPLDAAEAGQRLADRRRRRRPSRGRRRWRPASSARCAGRTSAGAGRGSGALGVPPRGR